MSATHDATLVFWLVRDLCVLACVGMKQNQSRYTALQRPLDMRTHLAPHDLSAGGDHTKLGYVDLHNCTLGENTELRVHGRLRVLLDADDGELEGGLEGGTSGGHQH